MTGAALRLVPLDCPTCGAALAADGEDVVYYCTACRNGYLFATATATLEPVEVGFVATADRAAERYLPFWVLPAEIAISGREVVGGRFSGLMAQFLGGGSGQGASAGRGRFAIPAFAADLDGVLELAKRYTRTLPELGERLGERLTGGRYGPREAEKLAHFALIAGEVEKPDTLRRLAYEIRFGEPRLLGVGFSRDGERWRDVLYGVGV